jgi:tRNA 2-selenouridine synthase
MPIQRVPISEFLALAQENPVFDARSPSEYKHAHIPGAHSLPIFTDEQRAEIGTTYKQDSTNKAIKIGFSHFGLQLNEYIDKVEKVISITSARKVLVHCWRGGMRSGAMAWLLDFYGYDVVLLDGGYKSYRNYVLQQFDLPFQFTIVGGHTGSGKTEILLNLKSKGEAVIDLEGIASHKGSSFGALGMNEQPTQEQFENNVHQELSKYYTIDSEGNFNQPKNIWIENESQRIGLVNIPKALFLNLEESTLINIEIPFEERLKFITQYYGQFSNEQLVSATMRIQKRLGGLETKNAINFLLEKNTEECFRILLSYYDRQYTSASKRIVRIPKSVQAATIDPVQNAQLLLNSI